MTVTRQIHLPNPFRQISPIRLGSPISVRSPLLAALCLLTSVLWLGARAGAQTPPQLVVVVDQTPVIIKAPKPFVEVSYILPDAFAQRGNALASANKNSLLAWFIPALSLKEQLDTKLNEKAPRCRTLQVQAVKDMELARYDAKSFNALRDETLAGQSLPRISEDIVETVFTVLDLKKLGQKSGGQKILGTAELGPDSFTLCIAIGTEGSDQFGGRDVETSVTCVTYMLIKGKIILLSVSGPDLTAKELHNAMRLTREWIELLRAVNNAK